MIDTGSSDVVVCMKENPTFGFKKRLLIQTFITKRKERQFVPVRRNEQKKCFLEENHFSEVYGFPGRPATLNTFETWSQ
ncbi:hypothetical protein TNCT_198681 [Trichonephila clavata]|uniref:Uncharacterized protein n=1 Tax=Trichonephila clavata TaxID=2740835 RepID=A0A8X6FBN9_TRICU|nr:hypothetical protein TNCT_198681 [Trichonephila clavata]